MELFKQAGYFFRKINYGVVPGANCAAFPLPPEKLTQ